MPPTTRLARKHGKENIQCKASVSLWSPRNTKKKKGLQNLRSNPILIFTSSTNETVTCEDAQRKKLHVQVQKRSPLQDNTKSIISSMIYTDTPKKAPKSTKVKSVKGKTTGNPPPCAQKRKRSTPLKRACTPAKKTYFSMLTRNKSKVKGHGGTLSSATKQRSAGAKSNTESTSEENKEESLSGVQQDTAVGPSSQPTKLPVSTSNGDRHQSVDNNLECSNVQEHLKGKPTTSENNAEASQSIKSPGVPQGSRPGPLKSQRESRNMQSPESSDCFKLNVLLQGLEGVNWSPPRPIKDIDAHGDIMTMNVYAKDFYAYLQTIENKCVCPADYLCNPEPGMPTSSMRSVLLDWLMQVQAHLNLKDETLHLTARIIDKFQTRHPIDLDRFQLVGVGCLLLAAKYEERFAPEVALLVYLTDNSYTRQDIINMECLVWKTLNYDLCWPTTMTFLRRTLQVIALNEQISCSFSKLKTLASYLVDLALLSNSMASFYPSETAASAVRLALYVLCPDVPDVWDSTLTHYSNYTENQLSPCISSFAELVSKGARSRCLAPVKKHGKTFEYATMIRNLSETQIIMEFLNNETAV